MTSAFLRANFLTQQKEILNALVPCCHLRSMTIRFLYNNNGVLEGDASSMRWEQTCKTTNFPLTISWVQCNFLKRSRNPRFFFDAMLAFTISHLPLKMWTAFLNEWSSSNRCVFLFNSQLDKCSLNLHFLKGRVVFPTSTQHSNEF